MTGIQRIVSQLDALGDPEILQIDFVPIAKETVVYVHLVDPELNGGLPLLTVFDRENLTQLTESAVRGAIILQRCLNARPVRA